MSSAIAGALVGFLLATVSGGLGYVLGFRAGWAAHFIRHNLPAGREEANGSKSQGS